MNESVGILLGGNERQEWLLPWWWDHFRKSNHYPVAFVDFGFSAQGKEWCRAKGQLIDLRMPPLFVRDRDEVDSHFRDEWEAIYPDGFWDSREAWFKKPAACLVSPFDRTIWIDLDCQIVGPLDPLFAEIHPTHIAIAKDIVASRRSPFPIYNSGVIVFPRGHSLIVEWARQAAINNGLFRGDQDLLAHIIQSQGQVVHELSPLYNWSIGEGMREDVKIYHLVGDAAKSFLRTKLTLSEIDQIDS